MNKTSELYKRDTNGNIRVWWMEYDEEKYRACSGVRGGKIVQSGWKYPEQKNVGRSNETSIAEQVVLEVESMVKQKREQGGMVDKLLEVDNEKKFVECMLAQKYTEKTKVEMPIIAQSKLDGVRCLITRRGMFSRRGKPIISAPHIMNSLDWFFKAYPNYVLDGELYNHEFHDEFEKIISLVRKTKPTEEDLEESKKYIEYHVYDVITDNSDAPYKERWEFLNVTDFPESVKVTPIVWLSDRSQIEVQLDEYLKANYEGMMLRVPNSKYEQKRSKNLLKCKVFVDDEFEVVDIIEGVGSWNGFAKAIMIRLPDGRTQESGMRGNFEFARNLLENKEQYIGGEATIIYHNKTSDGKLRFPVMKSIWKNKRNL